MKIKTLVFVLFSIILTAFSHLPSAYAHADGHGPISISEEQATYNAQMMKESLVDEKKLETSWLLIKRETAKVTKKLNKGQEEWMVTFVNEKAKDPAKRTLYMFFSLNGKFIAANHTGN